MSGTTPNLSLEKQRFIQALEEARIKNKYSQRQLCDAIGITIGTLTKYNRGSVDPNRVGVAIMRRLAGQLGITTNTLMEFLDTGEFRSSLTIDDVASWIRSESGQEDLPVLLAAATEASQKSSLAPVSVDEPLVAFTDADAEMFTSAIRSALKEVSSTSGISARQVWTQVEEQLIDLKCEPEEVNTLFELSFGILELTGEMMTQARTAFAGRFPTFCPLIESIRKIGALTDYSELDAIEAKCCLI